MPTTPESLLESNYLSLATRRKNGAMVETPVWFAGDTTEVYVFSAGDAGKVKRIRNFADVKVAPCNVSGSRKGDWLAARATLINSQDDTQRAYAALYGKYRWQMRLTDLVSKISGHYKKRQLIRITLAS